VNECLSYTGAMTTMCRGCHDPMYGEWQLFETRFPIPPFPSRPASVTSSLSALRPLSLAPACLISTWLPQQFLDVRLNYPVADIAEQFLPPVVENECWAALDA
jgi:hypothetical protein